jgi:predicted  nucleic acid-binding Zn-ribbon protein
MNRSIALLGALALAGSAQVFATSDGVLWGAGPALSWVADAVEIVDMDSANAEIGQIEKDLAGLLSQNDQLAAAAKELQTGMDGNRAELKGLLADIDSIRVQIIEHRDLRGNLRDAKLQAKLDVSLAKLEQAVLSAIERRNILNRETALAQEKLDQMAATREANNRVIDRKSSRKTYLQAAVAKTGATDATLLAQLAEAESLLARTSRK